MKKHVLTQKSPNTSRYSEHEDDEDKDAKHKTDNQKRLKSLKERQAALKSQKKIIENALADLDSRPVNKKIVFDSDAEEEVGSSTCQTDVVCEKADSSKKPFSLFDEDGEETEDEAELNTMFKDKAQFHGAAGKKLFELQSRIADSRFKLDERFAKERDDDTDSDNKRDSDDSGDDELVAEKNRNLKVLQDLMHTRPKPPEANKKKFVEMVRYDASKVDHAKYVKRKQESTNKKRKASEMMESTETDTEPPPVSQERFFEIDPSLSGALRKECSDNEESSFSLLKMFDSVRVDDDDGGDEDEVSGDDKITYEAPQVINFAKKLMAEEKETNEASCSKEEKKERVFQKQSFFFTDDDPRFAEGIAFSCRKRPESDIQNWKEIRASLFEIAKRSQKVAAKRKLGSKKNANVKKKKNL